jgi:hypothetical protein
MVVVPCSAAELRGKQGGHDHRWLASLGMSEYAQHFADNRIDDVSILRDLTDQDLKDIGVPLGHRRKMLRAIAEMVGAALTQIKSAPEPKPRDDAGVVSALSQGLASPRLSAPGCFPPICRQGQWGTLMTAIIVTSVSFVVAVADPLSSPAPRS